MGFEALSRAWREVMVYSITQYCGSGDESAMRLKELIHWKYSGEIEVE
jgi:hypothetical protein